MKQRPILFQGAMVRALLDGSKTQTRRIVKGAAIDWISTPIGFNPQFVADAENRLCPYGHKGDRLWVRETWRKWPDGYAYRATHKDTELADAVHAPWKPSIHMPRAASRITLEITGVRIEHLQAISEVDALAEGIDQDTCQPVAVYRELWESINGHASWDANPHVWVIEFKRIAGAIQ
jgi:hypothetical protein